MHKKMAKQVTKYFDRSFYVFKKIVIWKIQ